MKRIASLVLCAALAAHPAVAKEWTVDYAHSQVGFTGTQSGAAFKGWFPQFTAQIDFDPAKPETGKISATINIVGVTAGSADRDSYLPQADWFDIAKFPQAQFTSTAIAKTGDNAYRADGTLTIKGIAKPVSVPFTLKPEGDHWRAQGTVELTRTDFHIGEGDWSNEDYVRRAVTVNLDIAAKPKS